MVATNEGTAAAATAPTTGSAPAPAAPAGETGIHSLGRRDWATWPKYEAAVLGFRDYWYPVTWSRKVTTRPTAVTVLGESIMLIREAGVVRALHDRCPHRGVPLSHPMASHINAAGRAAARDPL